MKKWKSQIALFRFILFQLNNVILDKKFKC